MTYFTDTRTSRRLRRCEDCREPIQPGQRYERHSMPPGGELGNVGWWHITTHRRGDCPTDRAAEDRLMGGERPC